MTKRTKQQRLLDVIDLHKQIKGFAAVSTDEVSVWAIANKLHPVPTRRASDDELAKEWDARFDAIKVANNVNLISRP